MNQNSKLTIYKWVEIQNDIQREQDANFGVWMFGPSSPISNQPTLQILYFVLFVFGHLSILVILYFVILLHLYFVQFGFSYFVFCRILFSHICILLHLFFQTFEFCSFVFCIFALCSNNFVSFSILLHLHFCAFVFFLICNLLWLYFGIFAFYHFRILSHF